MKVSNVGIQNYQQGRLPRAQKKEGTDFLKLWTLEGEEIPYTFVEHKDWIPVDMKNRRGETVRIFACKECEYNPEHVMIIKCSAWGRAFDTNEELSKYYPHLSFPMEMELVHVDLSALTDEIKAELNAKYQINNIKPYSKEYFALMKDLQEAGVLSDGNAYKLPPNMRSLAIDEDGKVKGFATQFLFENSGKNANFLDYAKNTLSFVADDFEEMKTWDWLTNEEQMAISVYEMNQNIVAAMEEIFAAQLGLEK